MEEEENKMVLEIPKFSENFKMSFSNDQTSNSLQRKI